jgi:hypothetical protein
MPKHYRFVKNLPVADFWYQGNHSHPVFRRVLITESNAKTITGYEWQCGRNRVTRLTDAPVKTYRRDCIARIGELDKRRNLYQVTPKSQHASTTLVRRNWDTLVVEGL